MRYNPGYFIKWLVITMVLLSTSAGFAAPAEDKAREPGSSPAVSPASESSAKPVDKVGKPHKNKVGESHRDYKHKKHHIRPIEIIEEKQAAPTLLETGPRGSINPTAPNTQTQVLSADFTDSDGDGMTDVAELKFGFDPLDPNGFPAEPPLVTSNSITAPLPASGIGATYDYVEYSSLLTIRWSDPIQGGTYMLNLKNGTQQLYYGGHPLGSAPVSLVSFGLNGTETLTGRFSEYAADRNWVRDYPEFTINLSQLNNLKSLPVQAATSRLSYTFQDFPADKEQQYRDFLKKLFPIMYYYLGPPAESFNIVITNMGFDSGYFMSTDDGRTFLSDTDFIPRLIAHEFVHAWKGRYVMASDANWDYDDLLSGFEEGMAEGMAFEIMHEFVRSYPTDPATIQLLNLKPYQYWSSETTYYDSVRFKRDTTAGDFWDPSDMVYDKYSTAATTFEIMQKTNPLACRQILEKYYTKINSDPAWRSNRTDLINLWAEAVPQVNGIPLGHYLDSMPVFAGKYYDEGVLVESVIRPYGPSGDHQYATTYVNKDGGAWWGIQKSQLPLYNLPFWVSWMDAATPDNYVYVNTQGQPFTVNLYNSKNEALQTFSESTNILTTGNFLGYGWKMVNALNMGNFPVGLYRETVSFTNYLPYDSGAREDRYFFGVNGLNQAPSSEYIIMIGVDGVSSGTIAATINGTQYTQPISNGAAVFRSTAWPFDLEGSIPITVTRIDGTSHTYYRTLLEAGTYWNYFQTQFIIKDKDFDGVEDEIQAVSTGISATSQSFGSTGGNGSVKVKPQPAASWTATASEPWITITSGSAGVREGLVYYDVASFTDTASRAGTITINNQAVRILQVGANDTSLPTVTIDSPGSLINNTSLTITGTVSQYSDVTVNSGTSSVHATVTDNTWSCTLTGLAQGYDSIVATAVAPNGKTSTATVTVTVDSIPPAVSISAPALGDTDNTMPVLTYTVSDGAVVVKVDGAIVTKVSGDVLGPLSLGSHTVSVEATDIAGNVGIASVTFTVIPPPLVITSSTLPDGYNGTPYSQTLTATGGKTPYAWSVSSGSLPSGLSLNAGTGVISGTPKNNGSVTFTVQVKDADNTIVTKSLTTNILAARADLILNGVTAPVSGTRGSSISVSTSVKNQGSVNAGSFTIAFYLSSDDAITTSDFKLGEKTVKSLNKGNTTTVSGSFTIPSGIATGNYYVGVIVDANATIMETDESNNTKAASSTTDVN